MTEPYPDGDWSLRDAQNWLRDQVDDGARCPCCTQYAKVYRRKINSGMARALVEMYVKARNDWIHKPTALSGLGAAARDESLLRYWGLIEESSEEREDGGRAGWWRVTELGSDWLHARVTVPKYARVYDGRCLGLTGEPCTAAEALGARFDLRELMAGL